MKDKKRGMMIDIETLNTTRTSVVIQVAGTIFDYSTTGEIEVGRSFDIRMPVADQIKAGRTVSADTLAWWLSTPEKVAEFHRITAMGLKMSYAEQMASLMHELFEYKVDRYWFQGPTFDAIILEDLLGGEVPWKYYQVRDQRTLDDIVPCQDMIKKFKAKITHNALEDVHNQIKRLSYCMAVLNNG